jgi:hypothetical protein
VKKRSGKWEECKGYRGLMREDRLSAKLRYRVFVYNREGVPARGHGRATA